MAGETVVTIVGNLTADPELRFTPSGAAVANFTIASTPRVFDKQANEWKDQEALFMRCSIWREAAENVAESLAKGQRVIAQGRLKANSYDDKDGNRRTSWELDVDEVGPSLRFATASVTRNQRGNNGGGNYNQGGQGGYNQPNNGPQGGYNGGGQQGGQQGGTANPWGPNNGAGNYDWSAGQDDEPPF